MFKPFCTFYTVFLLLLFTSLAWCGQRVEGGGPTKSFSHSVFMGMGYTHVSMKPKSEDWFDGHLFHFKTGYSYLRPQRVYGAFQFDFQKGPSENNAHDKRRLTVINGEERLGYPFHLSKYSFSITPFTGLGFKYSEHRLAYDGQSNMAFRYNQFYVPIGLLNRLQISEIYSIGLNVVWFGQIFSTVSIHPLSGAQWNIQNRFKNVSIQFHNEIDLKPYLHHFVLSIAPSFEFWEDGGTDARTSSGIPLGLESNKYVYLGGTLNLAYRF